MAPKLKLIYFDVRGRGELIRYILYASGVEFEDERVQFADWPARKEEAPSGQLPYMEIEGNKYNESLALCRYLAKKYNLAGKNDLDVLSADIIVSMVDDVRNGYVRYKFDSVLTEDQKKSLIEKFASEKCPAGYDKLEKMLTESKSGFLVGSSLTIADLAVVDLHDQIDKEVPEFLSKYPKVTEHREKIRSLPKLAAYLAGRKDTPL